MVNGADWAMAPALSASVVSHTSCLSFIYVSSEEGSRRGTLATPGCSLIQLFTLTRSSGIQVWS
ncbi:hypothetical protein D3C80_1727150 [compost metagenome]